MKVLHLSASNFSGAGIAASRLCKALQKNITCEQIYYRPYNSQVAKISILEKLFNGAFNFLINTVFHIGNINVLPSSILTYINQSDADIVHLHWINAETISIEQIGKIEKPIVWSFHDMWPICGSENIVYDDRYKKDEHAYSGISKWVWKRKQRSWSGLKAHICCPSTWLKQCVQDSYLFGQYPVSVLPNGLDLKVYCPSSRRLARIKYNLPESKSIILFGACDPHNENKGGDLLREALALLSPDDIELAVFGSGNAFDVLGFKTHHMGFVHDQKDLAQLYSAADLVCVPSRLETFGQTASEPQSCGVPVVAFNATGMKDVVEHKITGYLAKPYDVQDLAAGIQWVLHAARPEELAENARLRSEKLFGEERMIETVLKVYQRALGFSAKTDSSDEGGND